MEAERVAGFSPSCERPTTRGSNYLVKPIAKNPIWWEIFNLVRFKTLQLVCLIMHRSKDK